MTFQTARYATASAAVCASDGVELGVMTDSALVELQTNLGEARRTLDALTAEVAGVIATRAEAAPGPGGIARRVGYKNAQDLIADTLGSSKGEAFKLTNVGKALVTADAAAGSPHVLAQRGAEEDPEQPRAWLLVAAAVRDNVITVEKAEILTSTLDKLRADEDVEAQFVRLAARLRPYDLRRVCAREVVLRDPKGAMEREKQLFKDRSLTITERNDGMTVVNALLDPMSAGHFKTWLDAQVRAGLQSKRENLGDERTANQMRVDALVMLAQHAMKCDAPGSGVPSTMVVRVDLEKLEAGVGFGTCDALQAPISVPTLRAMAVDAQVIPAVMGGDSLPLDVGRAKRCATPYQRAALAERDGGCAWCHAPVSYCDVHHIVHWQDGGPTDLSNLVMLCVSCHHQIHFGRWRIEVVEGVVWFTPPADVDPTRTPRRGGKAHLDLAA